MGRTRNAHLGPARELKGRVRLSTLLFPEYKGKRGPLPKQSEVFRLIRSGEIQGGGVIYQGGKGSGKTIVGAATDVWVHHHGPWRGCTSLIGRESYPALCMSTADEFWQIVDRLPPRMIASASKPSKNSYGYVDWKVGGTTLLCSLSNSDTWESANLGFAWVDEGHRQNPKTIGDLETRLRQTIGPRCMVVTTNPMGQGWMFKMANPRSKTRRRNWAWIEAASVENPTLPQDYIDRLISRYGLNTPAYKRWVLGSSTALEGSVFTEFDHSSESCIHVVPPIDLLSDDSLRWGRGLDYGLVNPTAVVYGARDQYGGLWLDQMHYAPEDPDQREEWSVPRHAERIMELDEIYGPEAVPADPSIFAKNHYNAATGSHFSTADEFFNHGVHLTPANNDRQAGLSMLLDLMAIDGEKVHPITLERGSPSLYIVDRPCMQPLISEFLGLLWAKPDGTAEMGRPDDVAKKNDHAYDATRYLAMDDPGSMPQKEPKRYRPDETVVGSRGRRRAY